MSTAADIPASFNKPNWFERSEGWLDRKGKGAWIGATVLGFIFFWPVGFALLAYMIWSKKMFNKSCCSHHSRKSHKHWRSSGNMAFNAYRQDTIDRLAQEQQDFEAFLDRLRQAKDKAEFDEFLKDREKKAS
jgi:hypothetical protein